MVKKTPVKVKLEQVVLQMEPLRRQPFLWSFRTDGKKDDVPPVKILWLEKTGSHERKIFMGYETWDTKLTSFFSIVLYSPWTSYPLKKGNILPWLDGDFTN